MQAFAMQYQAGELDHIAAGKPFAPQPGSNEGIDMQPVGINADAKHLLHHHPEEATHRPKLAARIDSRCGRIAALPLHILHIGKVERCALQQARIGGVGNRHVPILRSGPQPISGDERP